MPPPRQLLAKRGVGAHAVNCAAAPLPDAHRQAVRATYWSGQDGGLVAQHKELDRLGPDERHDREQPEDLPEDHIQQPQRLAGIMSDR